MVPGDDVAGRKRLCWVRRLLGVGLLALRDFVHPTEDLAAARGVLLDPLEALEALEAFLGDHKVSTMTTKC